MIPRNLLKRVLIVLLTVFQTFAHADTYSASKQYLWSGTAYFSSSSWFDAWKQSQSVCQSTGSTTVTCTFQSATPYASYDYVIYRKYAVNTTTGAISDTTPGVNANFTYVCPNGGTLDSATKLCTKSCTAPQQLQPDGSCVAPNPCPSKSGGFGWMASPVGGPSLDSQAYCDNGCMVGLNVPSGANNPGFAYTNGQQRLQKYEIVYPGAQCSSGAPLPSTTEPAKTPPEPPKRPNCSPNEGVLTSSTGQVHCVPEGTPASKPPIVTKEQQTKTNADGTTTTTETTTTRDSQTGAEEKKSTSTTKDANGNTVSVTSDTTSKGTTTGGNPDKPGDSDFCQKNPTLDICTGKLAKEETLGKIKDSLDPKEAADKSKLDAAKQDFDDKQKAHKDFIDAFAAKAQSDEGGLLKWAMIPEVPAGSCVPFTGTVMGRVVTFDFCDSMAKVRDIAGYGFYLMTMFALFAIFASSTTSGGKS